MDRGTFILLYKAFVRPHLEFAKSVWYPHIKGDIGNIESVQKRATKLVISLKNLSYQEHLIQLKLPTLKYRSLRRDVIEVFKILNKMYGTSVVSNLHFDKSSVIRGNKFKLIKDRFNMI